MIDDPHFERENTILVNDCLAELQALASYYRKNLNIPVLAITGTNGKTTTKELLATVMTRKLKVHYTRGNLNNHIGVPLTILSAPADTQMMIVEMGANHIGEIGNLCSVAMPDYGIITNIGTAHIEGFGSFEGVVSAKSELYDYLHKVNGVALYNDKNPLLAGMIFRLINRSVPFSRPTGTELMVVQIPSDLNLKISVKYQSQTYNINTRLFGAYNLENVIAAIATGLYFGVEMSDIAEAVSEYQPVNNRSQIKITRNNTLICDAYNANPVSMNLALQAFADFHAESKVVIIGDMLELGEKSEEEHKSLLSQLVKLKIRKVLLVGPQLRKVSSKSGFKSFPDANKLFDFLKDNPITGSTILIKGSRGMGLEKVYSLL